MKRMILAIAVIAATCLGIGVILTKSTWAQKQQANPKEALSRRASFEIKNSAAPEGDRPLVKGVGGFPVRLEVSDVGRAKEARRLQVLIAVYIRPDLNSFKVGEMVYAQTDPKIMTTGPDESQTSPFEVDIPLLPGDYVAQIFLCDLDTPYQAVGKLHHPSFPNPELFPGRITRATAIGVHVDPE